MQCQHNNVPPTIIFNKTWSYVNKHCSPHDTPVACFSLPLLKTKRTTKEGPRGTPNSPVSNSSKFLWQLRLWLTRETPRMSECSSSVRDYRVRKPTSPPGLCSQNEYPGRSVPALQVRTFLFLSFFPATEDFCPRNWLVLVSLCSNALPDSIIHRPS